MNIKGEFNGIKWIGFERQRKGRRRELILKYKLPDGDWKPVSAPKDVTSETKFKGWALQTLETVDALGDSAPRRSGTDGALGDRIPQWLELVRADKDISGATYKVDKSVMDKHIEPRWGSYSFVALANALDELREWVRGLRDKVSAGRVKRIVSVFRKFIRTARLEKWTAIRTNPLDSDEVMDALPKKTGSRGDVVTLPIHVTQALLDQTEELRRAVRYAVAVSSGAADGELAGCIIGSVLCIDGTEPTLEILQAFKRGTKTGKTAEIGPPKNDFRVRPLPLNDCARDALKEWLAYGWEHWVGRAPTATDPLFPDSTGKFSRPDFSALMKADLEANGLPIVDHKGRRYEFRCLRRTFSTCLYNFDVPREDREQLMGQSSDSVNSEHYTARVQPKLRAAVQLLPFRWTTRKPTLVAPDGVHKDDPAEKPRQAQSEGSFPKAEDQPEISATSDFPGYSSPLSATPTADQPATHGSATKDLVAEPAAGIGEKRRGVHATKEPRATKNQRRGGYRGVYWNARAKAWEVKVSAGERKPDGRKRRKYIDTFKDPVQAARAFDEASIRLLGPDAPLNFEDERDDLVSYVIATDEHRARAEAAGVR
jgi:hypothetical protein